ncbi:hypothetical protein E2C01_038409 [Portunus trituberculatus]|uniref:Endonuclease/exonuclease/phosphatase domain-containing protein n=1 Tax=Portunus trituberculatus TaxID=210409 RepID=A0A5B7FAR4_PORTR|nr:hypothetical protein [Portunus trituberculatus]
MARKLSRSESLKGVYINKDLLLSERIKDQEMRKRARDLNQDRSEEAKQYFFCDKERKSDEGKQVNGIRRSGRSNRRGGNSQILASCVEAERVFVDLKGMYSNVDGLYSKRPEIMDLLKEKQPMVFCMVETKVKRDINLELFGWESYNIWKKDRMVKSGGGVCLLVHNGLRANVVETGTELAEVLVVKVVTEENEKITAITAYVPPFTGAWTRASHEDMQYETLQTLEKLTRGSNRILLCGDFNCKEVDWEGIESGCEEGSWGAKVFNQMTENALY